MLNKTKNKKWKCKLLIYQNVGVPAEGSLQERNELSKSGDIFVTSLKETLKTISFLFLFIFQVL